jgi:uncharacterized protein YndB with AHSA1/START domain
MAEGDAGNPSRTIAGRLETIWELLTSETGSRRWLGTSSAGRLRAGVPVQIDEREGQVLEVRAPDHVLVLSWPQGSEVTINFIAQTVTGGPASRVVQVETTGVQPIDYSAWRNALAAAELAAVEARQQRDPRQAVILIHGIGEQLPGTTIRGFARAALDLDSEPNQGALLMKPDSRLEPRHEIVRLQAFKNAESGLPRTDFLELYWQDLIRDTKWSQVRRWALSVARGDLPPKLAGLRRLIRATALLLVITAAVLAILLLAGLAEVTWPPWLRKGSLALTAASLFSSAVTSAVTAWTVSSLGDAARYLQPLPDNVAVRRAIRERGLTLLRSLHDSGQYHRVVLVGHSLGSVIALDILCEYWWEVYLRHGSPGPERVQAYRSALDAYRAAAEALPGSVPEAMAAYRSAQWELWRHMRRVGMPWLISDFVTLGSPLQYPWPFLADNRADFEARKAEMLIPEAPPRPEPGDGIAFETTFQGPAGPARLPLLNQAAVFAPTRWTNVAFPCRWWIFGDPVGGLIGEWFGSGVLDRQPAPDGKSWLSRHSPKLHSQYWTHRQPEGLSMLNGALDLRQFESLQDLAREFPLSRFLPALPEATTALSPISSER